MSWDEKTLSAALWSARFQRLHPYYKSVDGRTYQLDQKLPSTKPNFKYASQHMGHGFPSLIEIFRCDYYLANKIIWQKHTVPARERDRLLWELDLQFNQKMGRYTLSHDILWAYFSEKYPDRLEEEQITSYGELVYRAQNRR
jgi:hypothetical protein